MPSGVNPLADPPVPPAVDTVVATHATLAGPLVPPTTDTVETPHTTPIGPSLPPATGLHDDLAGQSATLAN